MKTKKCSVCRKRWSLRFYNKQSRASDGRRSMCKQCDSVTRQEWYRANPDKARLAHTKYVKANRDKVREALRRCYYKKKQEDPEGLKRRSRGYFLKTKYGITLEQQEALLVAQGGKCGIELCGVTLTPKNMAVDHDHGTKKVRGLLCFPHNSMLKATTREGIAFLKSAIRYLERHATA